MSDVAISGLHSFDAEVWLYSGQSAHEPDALLPKEDCISMPGWMQVQGGPCMLLH